MNELLQEILDTVDKKQVKSTCKRVMKKLSFKSVRDIENVADLALWLYIYDYNDYALKVCDLIKDVPFTGNHTLWDKVDTGLCIKARILREQGQKEEAKNIVKYVNQYRAPHLYVNLVEWLTKTIDYNIQSQLNYGFKADAREWRVLKMECAIKYREGGLFPLPDKELEKMISELKDILSQEK